MGEHKHRTIGFARALEVQYAVVALAFLPDPATGLITAVFIQEKFILPEAVFGVYQPFRAMFNIEGEGKYEVRCTWVGKDGAAPAGEDSADAVDLKGRQKFLAQALRMPPRPGRYMLVLEWRHPGQDSWTRGMAAFPMDVELARPPAPAPAAPKAS